MNRTLKQAAALLGKPQRAIREHLRSIGAIYHDGTVTPRYHGRSLIYCDVRQRWVPQRGQYESYGVLMVTEAGFTWLAGELGVPVTRMQPSEQQA